MNRIGVITLVAGVALAVLFSGAAQAQGPGYTTDLYAWYMADAGVNGEGEDTDGDPVTLWEDQSGNGYHLNRFGDTTRRAAYTAGAINSLPTVHFDGNDFVWRARGGMPRIQQPITYLFVSRIAAANTKGYIFDTSTGATREAVITGGNGQNNVWQMYAGTR